mmetsp:Transcript_6535/g.10677  ORF Transcript_6535/g.10677 Transcript_6535/m.10677 type:complete len:295 (+) Transcript_6535:463-1347(+)
MHFQLSRLLRISDICVTVNHTHTFSGRPSCLIVVNRDSSVFFQPVVSSYTVSIWLNSAQHKFIGVHLIPTTHVRVDVQSVHSLHTTDRRMGDLSCHMFLSLRRLVNTGSILTDFSHLFAASISRVREAQITDHLLDLILIQLRKLIRISCQHIHHELHAIAHHCIIVQSILIDRAQGVDPIWCVHRSSLIEMELKLTWFLFTGPIDIAIDGLAVAIGVQPVVVDSYSAVVVGGVLCRNAFLRAVFKRGFGVHFVPQSHEHVHIQLIYCVSGGRHIVLEGVHGGSTHDTQSCCCK